MKILLMTDLEGVSGVRDVENWCIPGSRFYPAACRLLTQEVNAAVDGFFAAGAKYIQVADGHGIGAPHGVGAIDIEHLDPRVEYAYGWPEGWPFHLDESFTGVAWIGQHAKAGTSMAHLPHTQGFDYLDLRINGVSIGEFGQLALCAASLGIPAFYGVGDQAFTEEAEALAPGIITCAVKRGVTPDSGESCTAEEYQRHGTGAIHIPPVRARTMIRQTAEAAAWKLRNNPPAFIPLTAPFERIIVLRATETGELKRIDRACHPSSLIELMRMPLNPKPLD